MRRDRIRNAFAFSLGAILLIGAGIATTGASIEPADLTFHNATEPESLDPAKVTGVPEGRVLRALFSGLTVQAPDSSESLPDIAESWNISPNGKVYTFRIRKTARWSDGSPCTADDFVYSWRRLFAPETAAKYAYLMWAVDGAEDYTKYQLELAHEVQVGQSVNEVYFGGHSTKMQHVGRGGACHCAPWRPGPTHARLCNPQCNITKGGIRDSALRRPMPRPCCVA